MKVHVVAIKFNKYLLKNIEALSIKVYDIDTGSEVSSISYFPDDGYWGSILPGPFYNISEEKMIMIIPRPYLDLFTDLELRVVPIDFLEKVDL